jgi:elongation factor G
MRVEVRCAEEYFGPVVGDINSRRGLIVGTDSMGKTQIVHSQIPLAETFGYSTDLRSLSQGRATYSMEFDHYQEVPKNIAAQLTKQAVAS